MYTGFVDMKKDVVVTSKLRGRRSYIFRLTLEPSAALRSVFEHLPSREAVSRLPFSYSRGDLLRTIERMDELQQSLSICASLELTPKEFKRFQRMRRKLSEADVCSFSRSRVVGEYFTGNRKEQVSDFLWDYYALNHNAWWRTYDVRSNIKSEVAEFDLSNPALMSALILLPSSEEMKEQVA